MFSTFNPSTMPAELIEGTLVQRESLAERLVELFEQSALTESKHNVLLAGPRGIGKSHLVSLVHNRLQARKDLSSKLCIAYLREDEWGINSYQDLLLRTFQTISEDVRQEERAPEDIVSELGSVEEEDVENYLWRRLKDQLGDKTLLLIIENLDSVFQKIQEEGQRKWRALMQTHRQWAVLATTPALFSGISRQVSPFYGFFEVIHLQALSLGDAIALLQKLAGFNKDEETAAFLSTPVGRARVRAVQHLAGGNHRIFVLFYDFLAQSGTEHFVTPLLKTIDALTPYYQSQMAGLSPQQQKIVNFLCEHQRPATVTVIAKRCLTTHQTAASQLKQLLASRYVRVNRIGRESFYELNEPLLRICVEAKTHRGQPLDLLVDFIRYWFSREELEYKLSQVRESEVERSYVVAALREYDSHDGHVHLTPEIGPLCMALTLEKDSPTRLREQAEELAQLSMIAEDWSHYARAMAWLDRAQEAIPRVEAAADKHPQDLQILQTLSRLYVDVGELARAEELLDRAIQQNPERGSLLLDRGLLLRKAKRNVEAIEAFKHAAQVDAKLKIPVAMETARALMSLGRFNEARDALSSILRLGETLSGVFVLYAICLAEEGNPSEALGYLDKAITAFEHDSAAWGNRGIILRTLNKPEEAIESFNRALMLEPHVKVVSHNRCELLLETNQYEVALESTAPEILSHAIFHRLLDMANSGVNGPGLEKQMLALKNAHGSTKWRDAFIGSLVELASFARDFKSAEELEALQTWSSAIRGLFGSEKEFSIVSRLFDVITRIKILDDRKALLELPREQRLLLIGENEEEDFLNPKQDPRR